MPDFFANATNSTINRSTLNSVGRDQNNYHITSPDPNDILRFIGSHAASNAFYNSEQRFPPPNCQPGTRVGILADLNKWIKKKSKMTRVCWVHGRAGVGKSAIMQNLSEAHARPPRSTKRPNPRLAASFFFFRNDPTRDKLDPFVATIIFQFLTSEPLRTVLGPSIIEAVRSNPKIFETTSENQFQKLILEPCSKVSPKAWDNLPNMIVIDGLDECILTPSQERLIAMIRDAIPKCRLIFLIASRPEPRICRAFEDALFTSRLHRLAIGDSPESSRDITAYFNQQFAHLRVTHHALSHLDISWPGEEPVQELVKRACGQFIFAVTVIKYLESDDALPTERLDDILHIRADDLPESPYPALDLLYHQILSACPNWDEVREVLRLIITTPQKRSKENPYSSLQHCVPQCTEFILGLKAGKVQSLLIRLHAVIEVPKNTRAPVRIPHASFTEFLSDPTRSQTYHVKTHTELEYRDLIARACLWVISINSQKYHQSLSCRLSWDLFQGDKRNHPLFFVFDLFLSLRCPSAELLAALDQFDPYSFATGVLNSVWHWKLSVWAMKSMEWAKSLGTQTPQKFISRMESFLHSFCVASPSNTAAERFVWGVVKAEQWVYGIRDWKHLCFGNDFVTNWDDIYILPSDR